MTILTASRSHYHILGVGSIGSLLAHHLRRNGHKVTLIFKNPEKAKDFISDGGKLGLIESYQKPKPTSNSIIEKESSTAFPNITYQDGFHAIASTLTNASISSDLNASINPIRAIQNQQFAKSDDNSIIQRLIITTKAHQTLSAISSISLELAPESVLIFFQNGMGVAKEAADYFYSKKSSIIPQIVVGTTTHGAMPTNTPFVYDHTGFGSAFIAKYLPITVDENPIQNASAKYLYNDCISDLVSLNLDIHETPYAELYEKLLIKLSISAVLNPISGLMQCKNGEILERSNEIYPDFVNELCNEISYIYSFIFKEGLPQWAMPEEILKNVINVTTITADNKSSMFMDLFNRSNTEIDYINGYLIKIAANYGVDAKYNTMLYNLVKNYRP